MLKLKFDSNTLVYDISNYRAYALAKVVDHHLLIQLYREWGTSRVNVYTYDWTANDYEVWFADQDSADEDYTDLRANGWSEVSIGELVHVWNALGLLTA